MSIAGECQYFYLVEMRWAEWHSLTSWITRILQFHFIDVEDTGNLHSNFVDSVCMFLYCEHANTSVYNLIDG